MVSLSRLVLVGLGITIAVQTSDGWKNKKVGQVNWRSKREATVSYHINLLLYIDSEIYSRFYSRTTGNTVTERANQTETDIKQYYILYAKSMNSIYSGINSSRLEIKISLVDILISKESERWIIVRPDGKIVTGRILDSFYTQLKNYKYGHAMLITGREIISSRDEMVAGRAEFYSICQANKKSVSVVVDRGRFESVRTACHELAHSLGVNHDATEPGCLGSDQYIMAGNSTNVNISNKFNPWRFSSCSVKSLVEKMEYITTLSAQEQQCLTRKEFSNIDQTLFENLEPGQVYAPDQQCQMIRGSNSYFYRDGTQGDNVCTNMKCVIGNNYTEYTAAEGTSCGSKKWCHLGRCVSSEQVPEKCVFGDMPTHFRLNVTIKKGSTEIQMQMTCPEIAQSLPSLCYLPNIVTRCCSSCDKIATSITGCQYGDKISKCSKSHCDEVYSNGNVGASFCCGTCNLTSPFVCRDRDAECSSDVSGGADRCYDAKFAYRCCKTCERARNLKRAGCEYGDKDRQCGDKNCDNNYYKEQCCESCYQDVTSFGHRPIVALSDWILLVMSFVFHLRNIEY
ncbi:hypothetical protein LOTGIDRAFT_237268 [Lottia gigantea]|uniref:Peptidase M12B domain-containing protein n=1 Tax=Lottia gigantea TaxID=225164 RepID=V4BB17_LOTGI|nr:hypothetical protein LOTGIDRAFT_237268 [Lottia gigantea]ESP04736.1 hypothetical protein LOTGIDRAFT_237268 [Lottia gigantea]